MRKKYLKNQVYHETYNYIKVEQGIVKRLEF